MKQLEKQLRNSAILAVIFSILGGATLGFVVGYKVAKEWDNRTPCAGKYRYEIRSGAFSRRLIFNPSQGYSKVAYGKGVNSYGDTVKVFEYADLNIKH